MDEWKNQPAAGLSRSGWLTELHALTDEQGRAHALFPPAVGWPTSGMRPLSVDQYSTSNDA